MTWFRNRREFLAVVAHMQVAARDGIRPHVMRYHVGSTVVALGSPLSELRSKDAAHGVERGGDAAHVVLVGEAGGRRGFQVVLDRLAQLVEPLAWRVVLRVAYCRNREAECVGHARAEHGACAQSG